MRRIVDNLDTASCIEYDLFPGKYVLNVLTLDEKLCHYFQTYKQVIK